MKVLVIGGTGHVSGAVVRAALEQGHAVWAVTRGKRPRPHGPVTWLTADRQGAGQLEAAVAEAGETWDLAVDCICYDTPEMEQNVAVLRERARHFVFVSTDFVYDPGRRTFPQSEEVAHYVEDGGGSQQYGHRKRACERLLASSDTGAMAWTVLRPCHIYGPTSQLGCLPLHGRDPQLIERLRRGEALKLVGGGHFLQQPILADDLARTILSAAGCEGATGQIFNAAGPEVVESRRYYEIVAEVLGVELRVEEIAVAAYREENPGHAPFLCHRVYDLSRLAASGLKAPATPLAEGLRRHVEGLLSR